LPREQKCKEKPLQTRQEFSNSHQGRNRFLAENLSEVCRNFLAIFENPLALFSNFPALSEAIIAPFIACSYLKLDQKL
jgi:hypothetical protein